MKTILIIEDDPDVKTNIEQILKLEKFKTLTAENGLIGLEITKKYLPDLIICDIMMPELDGYDVLKSLQTNSQTATIPFIFLTAKVDTSYLRQGMELGADDYLTKPFTPPQLMKAIATQLQKQSIKDQEYQEKINDLRYNISLCLPHELRTPLNGILGLSQLLINSYDSMPKKEVVDSLETIYNSGQRLHQLVQNFILFTQLELIIISAEQKELWQKNITFTPIQSMTIELAEKIANKYNRSNNLQLDLEEATIKINPTDFYKVLEELIDNAFKFSQKGTPVKIMSRVKNKSFKLSIIDQGRGITPEQIKQIGAYMQFERKLYEQQGSGLGLIISKRIIELSGGTLQIHSQPDKKTTVKINMKTIKTTNI
jgi:two-component system, sensor histidine kinase and response regulator